MTDNLEEIRCLTIKRHLGSALEDKYALWKPCNKNRRYKQTVTNYSDEILEDLKYPTEAEQSGCSPGLLAKNKSHPFLKEFTQINLSASVLFLFACVSLEV